MNKALAAFTFRELPFVKSEYARLLGDAKSAPTIASALEQHCRALGKGEEEQKKYCKTVTLPANRKLVKRIKTVWTALERAIETFGDMMRANMPTSQAQYQQLIQSPVYRRHFAQLQKALGAANRLLSGKQHVIDVGEFKLIWRKVSKKP